MRSINLRNSVEAMNDGTMSKDEFFSNLIQAVSVIADSHNISDKDDLVQDICLKILQKLEAGTILDARFFAWQIETEIVRYIEVAKKGPCMTALEEADKNVACVINEDNIVEAAFLSKALSLLKPREELILRKVYFEKCTYVELGKELGVNSSRVAQIHNEALRKTRRNIYCNRV